jgi:hypothetical protein
MFGPSRRVARRTARRTVRRQEAFRGGMGSGYDEPAPVPAPAAPAAPAEPDYTAELQKLASLHEQGIIDDADFDAKKKQILGI